MKRLRGLRWGLLPFYLCSPLYWVIWAKVLLNSLEAGKRPGSWIWKGTLENVPINQCIIHLPLDSAVLGSVGSSRWARSENTVTLSWVLDSFEHTGYSDYQRCPGIHFRGEPLDQLSVFSSLWFYKNQCPGVMVRWAIYLPWLWISSCNHSKSVIPCEGAKMETK